MGAFTSKLVTEPLSKERLAELNWPVGWRLSRRFYYDLGRPGGGDRISLKKGYESNGASVPRIFWSVVHPCDPDVGKAAWVHDYMYSHQEWTKWFCDAVFMDCMMTLKAPRWKRNLCWQAVRRFGGRGWKDSQISALAADPQHVLSAPILVDRDRFLASQLAPTGSART